MNKIPCILVADDEPDVLEYYSKVLRRAGYEVCQATSGDECLRIVRERRPAVVLLDVVLPDLNGVEVCKRIKADLDLRDVFVALCSGSATSTTDKVDALQSGGDDYLIKPVEPAELLARIRMLVKLRDSIVALRQSQEGYRSLAESSPDAIFILDREGIIQYANSVAVQWLRTPNAELLGRSQARFFEPDIARQHQECVEQIFATGEPVRTEGNKAFGGNAKWIETRFVPLRDQFGEVSSAMVIARDLTDAKRTGELLKESEKLSHKIIDFAMDGFVMLDLKGRLLNVNEAYCRMIGYSRRELLSMHVSDVEVREPSREMVAQHISHIVELGNDRFETCHRRKDGKVIELEVVATFLKLERSCVFAFLREITERKEAEKVLRASEERFRQLAENIREVFWITNPAKNEMIYVSPGYEEVWGRTCDSLYAAPASWVDAIHPDDRLDTLKAIQDKQVSGTYDEIYRIIRPDGSIRWVNDRAFPIRDGSGNVQRIVGIAEDITQQREAEHKLHRSNARQAAILRASLDAIVTIDHKGNIIEFNATAEKLFACSRAHAMGKEIVKVIIYPSLQEWFRNGLDNNFAAASGPVIGSRIEMPLLRADATAFPAEIAIVRIELPGPPTFTVFARDISGRKQAEKALGEAEAKYRSIFENAVEGIFQSTPDGRYLSANPALAQMLGYDSPDELIRTVTDIGRQVYVDPTIRNELKKRLEAEGAVRDFESELYCKDGTKIWARSSLRLTRGEDGTVLYYEGVGTDITERKRVETQLAMLGRAVESTTELICITDLQDRFTFVNRAFQETYGYSESEVLGKTPDILLSPRNPSTLLAEILEQSRIRGWQGEVLDRRKDGTEFSVFLSTSQIRDQAGQVIGLLGVAQDITLRKQAEEQIQLLADAVQSTQNLIAITDQENRLTFTNRAFLEAYGYQEAEVLGRTPDFLYSANSPASLREHIFQQTLRGGWTGELTNRRKDGTEFPISLSTSIIKSNEGRTLGLVSVARDISERKRAENQINAFSLLSHRLNTASTPEQAGQIIFGVASELFQWDSCHVFLYSPKHDKIIPVLALDTIDGRRIPMPLTQSDLKPSAVMRLVMKNGSQIINGTGSDSTPVRLEPFGDTSRRSASRMFVPIWSRGAAKGIISLQSYTPDAYKDADLRLLQALTDHCGDALHRIQMTSDLREAEAKYRGIVDNATEGIFQTTPEGRYLSANSALARMFGYQSPDELISNVTNIERQTYVSPLRRLELKQALETKGFVRAFEAERKRVDGSRFWISINARLVKDANGNVLYYEGTNQDVTERKRAKEELEQLPGRIIEAQEAERLRVARELHDGVNQLIAAAKVKLHTVQHTIAASSPAAGEILARCSGLIVQALEENRRVAHNLRPSDLDDFGLIIACRNLCKEFRLRTGIKVLCRTKGFDVRLPQTMELNLFRIVQEALNNIENHAQATSVGIGFSIRNDLLVLEIRDNGCGFNPKVSGTRRRKRRGMGLSNIHERAVLVGGTSTVESARDKGTRIVVQVPMAASA